MKRSATLTLLVALLAVPALAGDPAPVAPGAGCPMKAGAVQRTLVNLDNGVRITLTASDAKAVALVQEMAAACSKDKPCCKDCPMIAEGVTRSIEKTTTGVVITATSTDAAMVKKLQEHAAACGSGEMKGCCKGKAGHPASCPHKQHDAPAQS